MNQVFDPAFWHEFGVAIWNLIQLLALFTAALGTLKTLQKTNVVEKKADAIAEKTDAQTETITSIDQKVDKAATAAVAVNDKTDAATEKLELIQKQTDGSLSKLQEQLQKSHDAQIALFQTTQQQIIDAWIKQHEAIVKGGVTVVMPQGTAGGRRIDDVLKKEK